MVKKTTILTVLGVIAVMSMVVTKASYAEGDTTRQYIGLLKLTESNNPSDADFARTAISIYENGVSSTLMFMNAAAAKKGAAVFCTPANMQIDGSIVHQMILNRLQRTKMNEQMLNAPASVFAVLAFREKYPCH